MHAQEPTIEIVKGYATVRGTVSENVKGCEVDGVCYLVLGKPIAIRLNYHHGEYPPCPNTIVTKRGLSVKPGDRIMAFGVYARRNQIHTLDLCCENCSLSLLTGKK